MSTVAIEPSERRIPAELMYLKEVRDFADRAAAEFGFDPERRYQVKLALSEAVANAIKHGSRSAADTVRVGVSSDDGALVFEIADSGRFVPRPLLTYDIPESGRGLQFMRQLMDSVDLHLSDAGTLVRLTKRLQPAY